jgi:tRNA-splicing endonuclease subunit Sen2
LERKQFKIDRAAAMLDAAKAAEAVITTGQVPIATGAESETVQDIEAEENGNDEEGLDSPATTVGTAGTVIDVNTLTPQTFLVRPTRPDSNRNRGKNAFKRKPKPKSTTGAEGVQSSTAGVEGGSGNSTGMSAPVTTPAAAPANSVAVNDKVEDEEDEEAEDELDETLVEEMEHLQLSLEEAWFLSAGLGVLRIYEANSVRARLIS